MAKQSTDVLPFRDTNLSFADRADDLISRLTLEEKASQLSYDSPAIPRLGVPEYNWWNECLHGIGRAGLATVFPQAIGLAATFDAELVRRVAAAIADEGRAKYNMFQACGDRGIYKGLTFWTPNINIFRDPRWGRGHETYGECPYLTARLGVAFVQGLQGDDEKYLKSVATPKHYAVHSGPEKGRHGFDAKASPQDLQATYLPAFRATVIEGKAFSVMGAYNRLNGVPCCANDFLLNQTLRQQWGFAGYTVSDCGAIADIHNHHKVAKDAAESSALAVANGLDLCCGSDYLSLREAVERKLLTESQLERSLHRLLLARLRLGQFDPPAKVKYAQIKYDVLDCPTHRKLTLDAAHKSIVLLKNENNLLPLQKTLKRIAVIGPNADAREILLGNYNGTPPFIVSPVEGIRAKLGKKTHVDYIHGTTHLPRGGSWLGTAERGFAEAVKATELADVAILCLGLSPTIEGEEGDAMNSDAGGDRTRIELPEVQEKLLDAVLAVGKPVVVVLISGSAVSTTAAKKAGAVVQQFYPGQSGGTALADVLFGDHNPSGRLPVTFYHATSDLPAFSEYSMDNRTYRYYSGPVLYPFGFGLSYTKFAYADLTAETESDSAQKATVSITVKNTGKKPGDEIVQVYLEHLDVKFRKPIRQLVGVRRVTLVPGKSKLVKFILHAADLEIVDESGNRIPAKGKLRITVAGSQNDARSLALGAAPGAKTTVTF